MAVGLEVGCDNNWDASNNSRGASYRFMMAGRRGQIEIQKRATDGSNTTLSSTNMSISSDVWYEMEIDWGSDVPYH